MFGRTKPVDPAEDAWTVSETTHDGRRLIVRANIAARSLAGDKRLGIKVGLAIPFHTSDPDGMPSPDEVALLDAAEEHIVEELSGHARLVLVLTTNGMREFVAYTGNGEWLPEFDKQLQSSVTSHRVQIDARTDPQWTAYTAFVN
jgi:hypothetical protein